jgi:hypothetical protein
MRADIDDHDAVDWIQGIYLVMLLRDDLTPAQTRAKLSNFLMPAFATVTYLRELQTRPGQSAGTA